MMRQNLKTGGGQMRILRPFRMAVGWAVPVMITVMITVMIAVMITVAQPALAQSEYRAQPGDTVNIEVLEDSGLNRSLTILPDGRISFPFAGTVRVGGLTVTQIEAAITAGIESNFASTPNVFVSVQPAIREEPAPVVSEPEPDPTIDVYFLGEVNAPGLKPVSPGTTFLQAMAQSGGLTRFAADKRVQLRRTDSSTGQPVVFEFNYRAILDGAEIPQNVVLRDGDVIIVPERRLFE